MKNDIWIFLFDKYIQHQRNWSDTHSTLSHPDFFFFAGHYVIRSSVCLCQILSLTNFGLACLKECTSVLFIFLKRLTLNFYKCVKFKISSDIAHFKLTRGSYFYLISFISSIMLRYFFYYQIVLREIMMLKNAAKIRAMKCSKVPMYGVMLTNWAASDSFSVILKYSRKNCSILQSKLKI